MSHRVSAAIVLGLGIAFDILCAFLYHAVSDPHEAFTAKTFHLLVDAMLLSALLGLVTTSVGSVMWARRASNAAVIAAVIGLILATMIYVNRVTFGFDDGRVLIVPFVGLVVLLMIIGRAAGQAKANSNEASAGSKNDGVNYS